MTDYNQIIDFWVNEVGPEGWYESTPELDEEIRQRFHAAWQSALEGGFDVWRETPEGSLGYLILTDQFPRNMFREDPRAFATDPMARAVAEHSTDRDFDLQIDPPVRQFFYLPFEHSEDAAHQSRSVAFFKARMEEYNVQFLHARTHQEIIRLYERFPFRNNALGREYTEAEQQFLDEGGYQAVLERMKDQS